MNYTAEICVKDKNKQKNKQKRHNVGRWFASLHVCLLQMKGGGGESIISSWFILDVKEVKKQQSRRTSLKFQRMKREQKRKQMNYIGLNRNWKRVHFGIPAWSARSVDNVDMTSHYPAPPSPYTPLQSPTIPFFNPLVSTQEL